jgi:hypothetical protein
MALSAATIADLNRRGAFGTVILVDLLLRNGSLYYWSNFAGSYPMKLGAGGNVAYSPWIKTAGPFRLSRSLRADAGDLVVQNLSGNTLERDVALAIKGNEFGGALSIVRFWRLLTQEAIFEFHGFLTKPRTTPTEAQVRVVQLFDTNISKMPPDTYTEGCTWHGRFKVDPRCGSGGSATSCPGDFASCKDATRAATEHFNGVPHTPSGSGYPVELAGGSGGGGIGGGGGGGGGGEGGGGHGRMLE